MLEKRKIEFMIYGLLVLFRYFCNFFVVVELISLGVKKYNV